MEPEARSGWLARDMEKKKSYSGWSKKSGLFCYLQIPI